jgi:hypothetical protein
MRASALV